MTDITTYKNASLNKIAGLSTFQLSDLTECSDPDTHETPGAEFLTRIRDAVVEALTEFHIDGTDDTYTMVADGLRHEGRDHEIADSAVPIYTYKMWVTFVDLGAWDADIDDYGPVTDMTKAAMSALYSIALGLVDTLLGMVEDNEDDEDDELTAALAPVGTL